MADNQEAKARRETIEVVEFHKGVRHTGTRDALIAAGLARAGQFPGEPGCGKTSTVFPADGDRRRMQVSRRGTHLYDVVIYKTQEERAAYDAELQRHFEAQQVKHDAEQAQAQDEARRRLRREVLAHGGPKGMAMAAMTGAAVSLAMAFNIDDDPERPYGFPAATKAAVRDHFDKIMELFKSGGFEPRLGAVAAGDSEFQRFMRNAAGGEAKP